MKPKMATQSMRLDRTSGSLSESSPQNIKQTFSDPLNLKTVNSDDSSVFSGLGSAHDENDENKSVRSVRFADLEYEEKMSSHEVHKSTTKKPSKIGKYRLKTSHEGPGLSSDDDDDNQAESISVIRSVGPGDASESRHQATKRILGQTPTAVNHVQYAYQSAPNDHEFLYDHDASTMSYGSVDEFPRPRGKMKLVSDVALFDEPSVLDNIGMLQEEDPIVPPTPEGAENITSLFKEFEKEMDANISGIHDDDESVGGYSAIGEWPDIIPRAVRSEDNAHIVSHRQAKEMQRVLHKARTEVETLRDNNEQFIAEIEQTEEEHKSESKLYDERTKQKISELKNMYQDEIEVLIKEKDAAITEAGKQASRYADSGRKQITKLRQQIDRLKKHANSAVRNAVQEAATVIKQRKDKEKREEINALQKDHQIELEKLRLDWDGKVQEAVNEAVAKLTQRMIGDRDREVNEAIQTTTARLETANERSLRLTLDSAKVEIDGLKNEREATQQALKSVKQNFDKHYPEQMKIMRQKHKSTTNPMRLLQAGMKSESDSEKLFREVLEAFAFLVEQGESKAPTVKETITSVHMRQEERSEVYVQARNELMLKHRAELEENKKQLEAAKEKIERLEQSLRSTSHEKRALQEKHRRDQDNHRAAQQKFNKRIEELEKEVINHKNIPPPPPPSRPQEGNWKAAHLEVIDGKPPTMMTETSKRDRHVRRIISARRASSTFKTPQQSQETRDDVELARSPSSSVGKPICRYDSPEEVPDIQPSVSDGSNLQIQNQDDQSVRDAAPGEKFDVVTTSSSKESSIDISVDPGLQLSLSEPETGRLEEDDTSACEATEPATPAAKKAYGILSGFRPKSEKDQKQSEKNPTNKTESNSPPRPNTRMGKVQKFRSLFESSFGHKSASSDGRRGSLTDESTSSLVTDTGANTPSSMSMRETRSIHNELMSPTSDELSQSQSVSSTSEHGRTFLRKKKNPLGMFASKNHDSSLPREADEGGNTYHSEERAAPPTADNLNNSSNQNQAAAEGQRSVMKPPLSGFDPTNKVPMSPHVINGKKPPLPEWSSAASKDEIFKADPASLAQSQSEEHIPNSIDVRTSHKRSHSVDGHTMCLEPMALANEPKNKKPNKNRKHSLPNDSSSQGTYSTALSTDDDGGPMRHSQRQMRNFPPLGDQSDDESGDEATDRYASFDPPAQFAQDYPSPSNSQFRQMVLSRSAEDCSPVIYMDSSQESKPVVVHGQKISRNPGHSAFTPRHHNHSSVSSSDNDNDSNTGSEATTTITAHTFRSSFNTDPSRLHKLHRQSTGLSSSKGGSTRRYTLAAMKARRSRRQGEF